MPKFESADGIGDVLAAPLGEVIAAVGRSVAEAQQAMDAQTLDHFRSIYAEGSTELEELRSIGYQPTWYQIPEATAEISIALTMTGSREAGSAPRPNRLVAYAAPVDAGYQSKFNYGVQASSSLKFRVVPVPPPSAAARLRVAPKLVGLTLKQARAQAEALDLAIEVIPAGTGDDAVVAAQRPAPGGVLPSDSALFITEVTLPDL